MLQKELLRISGRHSFIDDVLYLGYSASFVEFLLEGKKLEAVITSDCIPDEEHLRGRIAVFYDNEDKPAKRIELKKGSHTYTIYESRETASVKIRIMKYSEAAFASVGIEDLIVEGNLIALPKEHKKKIEFIGDSITCGYGIEAENELITFHTKDENPWEAYACKTARKLDMDFELVSWSGNGIITHYVDPSVNEVRLDKPLMPELYPYTDRELEERKKLPLEKWVPLEKPDIIVVNLGTNDCSFTREIGERNTLFKKEYQKFLELVRSLNPQAKIIAVCGIMDARLNQEMEEVVTSLQKNDSKLFYQKYPVQLAEDGRGADYHPSLITHEKVAVALSEYIKGL